MIKDPPDGGYPYDPQKHTRDGSLIDMKSNEKEKPAESKLQTWTYRILGALLLGPIVVAVIVGLVAVCIKFVQICIAWVS